MSVIYSRALVLTSNAIHFRIEQDRLFVSNAPLRIAAIYPLFQVDESLSIILRSANDLSKFHSGEYGISGFRAAPCVGNQVHQYRNDKMKKKKTEHSIHQPGSLISLNNPNKDLEKRQPV